MATKPTGPVDIGGDLSVLVTDQASGDSYSVTFYPDGSNDKLRNEGKPMSFYYLSNRVRMARQSTGDYMFHFQEFVGVMDQDTNIGVKNNYEIAGGLLTFSTTMEIAPAIFKKLTDAFIVKLQQQYGTNPLLSRKGNLPPANFQPISINSGTTSMDTQDFGAVMNPDDKTAAGGNTAFVVQGAGPMNLSTTGLNSYSTMVGLLPAASIKAALQSGHSTLRVQNIFKYWIQSVGYDITIIADWSQVYDHFSASLKGHYLFASADLSASFDTMKLSGAISVDVADNPFIIKDAKEPQNTKEMVLKMFMEKLQDEIFDKVPMEKAAEASDNPVSIWGVGVAAKLKKVKKTGTQKYHETYQTTLERETKVDGTLEGIYNELVKTNNDPKTMAKYFSTVNMGTMFQKIHVIATSNAYWKTPDGKIADPINKLALQVGYKEQDTNHSNNKANMVVKNSARYKDSLSAELSKTNSPAFWTADTKDRIYVFDFMKNTTLPAEEQNKVTIIKTISFNEDPRVSKKLLGAKAATITETTEEHILELRADTLGKFGATFSLENAENIMDNKHIKVLVTVSMDNMPGVDRVFEFNGTNATTPRTWELWFENPADIPNWKYKVEVHVSGKTFAQKMLTWSSDFIPQIQKGDDFSFLFQMPDAPPDLASKLDEYLSS